MKRKHLKKKTERVAANKVMTIRRAKKQKPPVFNLLSGLLLWLAVIALFYTGSMVRPQHLVPGQQAPETVVASVDFIAETVTATELKKREAADQVLPVFTIETLNIERAEQVLEKLVPRLGLLRNAEQPEQFDLLRSSVADLLDIFSIPLSAEELLQVSPAEEPDLKTVILHVLSSVMKNGIIAEGGTVSRFGGRIAVRENNTVETIREINSFMTRTDGLRKAAEDVLRQLPMENRNEEVIRKLLEPWIQPNVVYNDRETAVRRAQARDLVEPVLEPVEAGTILVRSGDTVTHQALKWLSAHEKKLSELETGAERMKRLSGNSLLLFVGLLLAAAAAGFINPQLIRRRKETLLMLTLSLLPLMAGRILLYAVADLNMLPAFLLNASMPLALAPILASVLLGGSAALIAGLWTAFALAVLCGMSFSVLVSGVAVTLTAIYATRDVKRRITLFRAGLWAGAAEIGIALILSLLTQPAWTVLLPQLGTILLSGVVAALLAIILIPLFELLFNVTTDITLLELSDLGHPVLQSLALNAPGTYHHSLMMASLAQNAAEAIGANGLMLRVCAYFHDIGKLVKPGFFSENIQYAENPHDDLSPNMSTLVIISHIKEGVMLAKKYKLPQVVLDGIEQHQGTSLVSVFYHRAKTRQEQDGDGSLQTLNDEDFRYEGPRPQNKEMAILMLADSCEAASRSLDKPTPVRIAGLIEDIFDSRLRDGQMDECSLTLAELHKIKQSFIFTLTNMLHGRVAYPDKDENNSKKPSEETSSEPESDPPFNS